MRILCYRTRDTKASAYEAILEGASSLGVATEDLGANFLQDHTQHRADVWYDEATIYRLGRQVSATLIAQQADPYLKSMDAKGIIAVPGNLFVDSSPHSRRIERFLGMNVAIVVANHDVEAMRVAGEMATRRLLA